MEERQEEGRFSMECPLNTKLIHDVNKGRISYIGTSICRTASLCAGEKDNDKKKCL